MSNKKTYYNPNLTDLETEFDKYLHLVNKGTKDATVFFRLGRLYQELGEIEPAIENYEKALHKDPSAGEVYYNLGCVHKRRI